jgi:hypothetical protein
MSGALNVLVGGVTALFSAELNRDTLSGFASSRGSAITSSSVTCTPINGTGPFTYLWSRVSGDLDITAYGTTSHTTYFGAYMENSGDYFEAVWQCTITDATAATATSENVSITLERIY